MVEREFDTRMGDYKFITKLKALKEKIKKWNIKVFGDMRLRKWGLVRRIGELDLLET